MLENYYNYWKTVTVYNMYFHYTIHIYGIQFYFYFLYIYNFIKSWYLYSMSVWVLWVTTQRAHSLHFSWYALCFRTKSCIVCLAPSFLDGAKFNHLPMNGQLFVKQEWVFCWFFFGNKVLLLFLFTHNTQVSILFWETLFKVQYLSLIKSIIMG